MDSRLGVSRSSDPQLGTALRSRELRGQIEGFVPEGSERLEDPAVGSLASVLSLDAIQVHGSASYNADFQLEKLMRDAKMFEIGGGTK